MRKIFFPVLLLISITLHSCIGKIKIDLILYNGVIYMVDNGFSTVQAVAIHNGKILDVGSNEDILDKFRSDNEVDLKGHPVYPGFIDAHCHFFGYASDLMKCDLYRTDSFLEVLERLTAYSKNNSFSWILGRGWDQNDWENTSWPDKTALDSLFPNTPVFLMRIDGHAALCNSIALKAAGIDASTKIEGGEVLSRNGIPTGLLIDNAVDLVKVKIPPFTRNQNEEALLKAQQNCFATGLTTLDDAGLGKDTIAFLFRMQQEGKLKMRIYAMISDDPATYHYFFRRGPFKNDRLNVRAIKVYADGALGSRGACLFKPYSDMPGHYGTMLHDKSYFEEIADEAMENHFQMCTHAIGDSACSLIVKVYGKFLNGDNNRRWRLEHCQIMRPKDRDDLGDNAIIPSVQPTHATSDMYWAESRLGPDRMKFAYAYEDIRDDAGGIIAFGTDFPVENINPIYTFYAAVARKDLKGFPRGGFQPENKIKRKDALRAMTIWAAYANFEDTEKGSIEPGKFADLVVLDRDILRVEEDEIPGTKVLSTYLNGELVYSAR